MFSGNLVPDIRTTVYSCKTLSCWTTSLYRARLTFSAVSINVMNIAISYGGSCMLNVPDIRPPGHSCQTLSSPPDILAKLPTRIGPVWHLVQGAYMSWMLLLFYGCFGTLGVLDIRPPGHSRKTLSSPPDILAVLGPGSVSSMQWA